MFCRIWLLGFAVYGVCALSNMGTRVRCVRCLCFVEYGCSGSPCMGFVFCRIWVLWFAVCMGFGFRRIWVHGFVVFEVCVLSNIGTQVCCVGSLCFVEYGYTGSWCVRFVFCRIWVLVFAVF